jgi:uncharacterized membrane protein YhaH (DUF805 family)
MNWYLEVLGKYAVFTGRARRREYWMFFLVNTAITLTLCLLGLSVGGTAGMALYVVYGFAVLPPSLGVFVRRMHDTGRSGWWFFAGLIPFLGGLVLLVFLCQDGEPGENAYGENPKAAS